MTSSRIIRVAAVSIILLITAGCDQTTKHLARTQLPRIEATALPGRFIQFTLAENPGAFLSLGAELPGEVRNGVFTIGVALGLALLLGYLVRTPRVRWPAFLGLTLVCAGGMSNLFDRITRHGLVTDFMVIQIGPVHTGIFNVADFAVAAGLVLVVVSANLRPAETPALAGGRHVDDGQTKRDNNP